MRSGADPPINGDDGPSVQEQLTALQQTHQATLTDLSAVTDKYRDALREISDLAAQIQEAKLQSAAALEQPEDRTEPWVPTPRRRLTVGSNGSLRSPRGAEGGQVPVNGGGRRLFFRQAASTESLHARSLSQSPSLSQELSSVRSPKLSLTSRPDSLAIPTSTLLSPPISHPNQPPTPESPNGERSAASLEKEIMRLQEVLKEREAEISTLEQSLKEKPVSSSADVVQVPAIAVATDTEAEVDDTKFKELSPTTLKQFKALRRLSLQKTAEPAMDTSETLDRLNELMLYVKFSIHCA